MSEWKVALLLGAVFLVGTGLLEAHDAYTDAQIAQADCVQPKTTLIAEVNHE